MRPAQVLSVTEFRAGLAGELRRVQAPDSDPVFVGSHRKPQAVVMSVSHYERLVDAAAWREAVEEALASVRVEGGEPTPEGRAVLEAVTAGRLSEEQAVTQLVQRHTR
jgi:prevent-host-death family protein